MKEKILVSACLLGTNCKYNGGNNRKDEVIALEEKYELIPVCPESFGELKSPRVPSERKGRKVFSKDGEDLTDAFVLGAERTLNIAIRNGITKAVLKERSPSCGSGEIYDGSFSGKTLKGDGMAAELLKSCGIKVYGESRVNELL